MVTQQDVCMDVVDDKVERDGVVFSFEPMMRSTVSVKRLLSSSQNDPSVVKVLKSLGKYSVRVQVD